MQHATCLTSSSRPGLSCYANTGPSRWEAQIEHSSHFFHIFGSRYRRYRFPHAGSSHGLPGSSLLRADWIGDRDLRPAWISPDSATGRPPDQRRHLLYATNRDQNITAPCQTAMPHNRGENEQAGSSVGFAHFTPLWGISGITLVLSLTSQVVRFY